MQETEDPYSLRSAARRSRSASVRRRDGISNSAACSARSDDASMASPACASRSGRRMRAASRWSAISTAGTGAAIRCGCAMEAGVWELFVPRLTARRRSTSTRLLGPHGSCCRRRPTRWRCRPRMPPAHRLDRAPIRRRLQWTDAAWMERRARSVSARDAPISIYEVHAAPGCAPDGRRSLDWDELAEQLIPYVVEHGLHPYRIAADHEASVRRLLGLPAARPVRADRPLWAAPAGFARFVDRCHAPGSA